MLYIQAEPDSVRWLYGIFSVLILLVLSLDLGLFNRKAHAISVREASIWTAVWIGLAMAFSGLIYLWTRDSHGLEKWTQFQTAYWIEKALSMDNLFVFMLIFNYFKVPDRMQHKVLFWGVIGALGMRALFIYAGVELVRLSFIHIPMPWLGNSAELEVNVLLFLFGGFLLFAGLNSLLSSSNDSQEFAGKGILDRISSVCTSGLFKPVQLPKKRTGLHFDFYRLQNAGRPSVSYSLRPFIACIGGHFAPFYFNFCSKKEEIRVLGGGISGFRG